MELRNYQRRAVDAVREYLRLLSDLKTKVEAAGLDDIDFAESSWNKLGVEDAYKPRRDGTGKSIPSFCMKIPTGGGKTLLAVKAIDAVNTLYRKQRSGLVLWVVPTSQIYNQTLTALRDREHPYRQHLDLASGGKTLIVERHQGFMPCDVAENLVVLILMLPAASRQTKEQLRMFRDSGGFQAFFPPEDDRVGNAALLNTTSNLDTFEANGFWGDQVKTSLGNTLRLLRPIIILDESQKAYSEMAQETLNGFNPSVIIELSATPPQGSNVLVDIAGTDLEREEMIKLDLHVTNKASPNWQDTLAAAVTKRDDLEKSARKYEAATGTYIRPICLVQVERTGADQRGTDYVHAEDVRERLIKTHRVPSEQIAIKSSDKDELKEVDDAGGLMMRDCQIRYIITKQALQEGWDCPFAYVLAVLTNPQSKTSMTQLVGRVLRQPYARKTRVKDLDESYVYCHRPSAGTLLDDIQKGLKGEGLGDIASRVVLSSGYDVAASEIRVAKVQSKFATAARSVMLPVFAVKTNGEWRPVRYETDIEAHITWNKLDVSHLCELALSSAAAQDEEIRVGLSDKGEGPGVVISSEHEEFEFDENYIARHVLDIVPNPWAAYAFGREVVECLIAEHGTDLVHRNHAFILEELRKHLSAQKDELAESIFRSRLKKDEIRFFIIGDAIGNLPSKMSVPRDSTTLNRADGTPLQKSLFDFTPAQWFNELETKVAWYLDEQDKLFFWCRNRVAHDYSIQGWRRERFWPDFVFTTQAGKRSCDSVYVIETKGDHLMGSFDTKYKQALVELCNREAQKTDPRKLALVMKNVPVRFRVLSQEAWERELNTDVFSKS